MTTSTESAAGGPLPNRTASPSGGGSTYSASRELAVYIGRFQPFHVGHATLLQHALTLAPTVIVVIGSAFQARTPKNPFSWREREQMIRLTLSEADRARVLVLPVRDYYDEARWTAAIRAGVAALAPGQASGIALVGHFKDATSDYLRSFPGWTLHSVERASPVNATALRNAYFSSAPSALLAALAALIDQAPPSTLDFLSAWSRLPQFAEMAEEWRMLRDYRAAWAGAPYPPVFVTVDVLLRCADRVLLIQRGQSPGKGLMALPGGFIEQRETAWQSALRELHEETNLQWLDDSMRRALKEVAVFDHPDRSQRGRTLTHAHYFDLGDTDLPEVRAGDDAAACEWVPIDRLSGMEDRFLDDHFHMLDHFIGLTSEV